MAGGSGTRFWPASRSAHPKQFLTIGSQASLLRQTAQRVVELVGWDKIIVVTGAAHAEHVGEHLPELPKENILVEPAARNTAPCIGWATQEILARDAEAKVAVLPADHFIGDEPGFRDAIAAAFSAASDRIVLFGIVPTRPETGYGYIERGDQLKEEEGRAVHEVARFVEKPDRPTAEGYLAAGRYLWNSGMFIFPASLMKVQLEKHIPELMTQLAEMSAENINSVYPKLPSISIDYGVMEQSQQTSVMPVSFAWSDVGSWDAAKEVYSSDAQGNVVLGDVLAVDIEDCLVDARAGRAVAAVGLSEVLIVDTKDALLVVRKGRSQDVKKIVETLKSKARKELL